LDINPPSAQASLSQPSSIPPVEASATPAVQADVSPAVMVAIRTRQVQVAEETAPTVMQASQEEDLDEVRERMEEQRMSGDAGEDEETDVSEEDAQPQMPQSFHHRIALESYSDWQMA